MSLPAETQWNSNLTLAAAWRRPVFRPQVQAVKKDKEKKCSCLLPWLLVAALATALVIQSTRKR